MKPSGLVIWEEQGSKEKFICTSADSAARYRKSEQLLSCTVNHPTWKVGKFPQSKDKTGKAGWICPGSSQCQAVDWSLLDNSFKQWFGICWEIELTWCWNLSAVCLNRCEKLPYFAQSIFARCFIPRYSSWDNWQTAAIISQKVLSLTVSWTCLHCCVWWFGVKFSCLLCALLQSELRSRVCTCWFVVD